MQYVEWKALNARLTFFIKELEYNFTNVPKPIDPNLALIDSVTLEVTHNGERVDQVEISVWPVTRVKTKSYENKDVIGHLRLAEQWTSWKYDDIVDRWDNDPTHHFSPGAPEPNVTLPVTMIDGPPTFW